MAATILQNSFLSTTYGRNWQYLWSSNHAKTWQIILLAIFFLLVLWTGILFIFSRLSRSHSWIIPIFAIGLGAPRWAQTLWSCSGIGLYLGWAGSPLASTLLGRSLWLWLGLLDALQGVGFGMILLQTLTRIHISATLLGAQVVGTATLMLARLIERQTLQTIDITFPTFGISWTSGLNYPWFWMGLACQIGVCVGFLLFFRKEQLSKP
jgi:alpha-1,3-glucan synthase